MTPGPTPDSSDTIVPVPQSVRDVLASEFLGNSAQAWLIALGVGAAVFVAVLIARRIVLGRVRKLAEKKRDGLFGLLPQLVLKTSAILALAAAIFAAASFLVLPDAGTRVVRIVVVAIIAVQAIIWGQMLVEFGLQEFLRRRAAAAGLEQPDGATLASAGILRFMAMVTLYVGVLLFALDNLNIDVTALIAGLGIGGIAIALAAQNILGDLFGSLSIVLDKPFVVGDFIIVGEQMGTVEKIGIKTTRVKALSGEQLVFANTDLLSSRVRNFKRMHERRVVFAVGVTYQTPAEKLELAQQILKEAVTKQDTVRFDRAHFKTFGAFSLDFEVVYFVLSSEFNVYMDRQQAINLHIYRRFEQEGIEFAYPTQTLFVADGSVRVTQTPVSNGAAERPANGTDGVESRRAQLH